MVHFSHPLASPDSSLLLSMHMPGSAPSCTCECALDVVGLTLFSQDAVDRLGLFAGIRDHFQQEEGKMSISYCT